MTKDFCAIHVDLGPRNVTTTTVGRDTHRLATLGNNGELDLVKVGKFVTGRSLECLTRRKGLVSFTFLGEKTNNWFLLDAPTTKGLQATRSSSSFPASIDSLVCHHHNKELEIFRKQLPKFIKSIDS
jgi:hypothetical protein